MQGNLGFALVNLSLITGISAKNWKGRGKLLFLPDNTLIQLNTLLSQRKDEKVL